MVILQDEEVIRKAVELASGFELVDSVTGQGIPQYVVVQIPGGEFDVEWTQFTGLWLDALAAELVRMVDTTGFLLISGHNECHIADDVLAAIANQQGTGRTMNALRCIVESGVLRND